nr:uncharacterized protein LOC117229261 [Megalopta genalis]
MKPRRNRPSCFAVCCLVSIGCFNGFVATVSPITFAKDSEDRWKFFEENVPVDERVRGSSAAQLPAEPEWIASSRSPRIPLFIDSTRDTVLFSTDKCSRYCIANGINRDEDNFHYINIFWSSNIAASENPAGRGDSQLSATESDKWAANNVPRKCQIYLDLDCDAEAGTSANSMRTEAFSAARNEGNPNRPDEPTFQIPVSVSRRRDLSGETRTKFLVEDRADRVVVNVEGNVSNAVLRIPMNVTVPWLGTVVSWTRRGETDGVRIDTNNAPPGEWWIKLTGEDNSKYHFTAEAFPRPTDSTTIEESFVQDPWISGTVNRLPFTEYRAKTKEDDFVMLDESINAGAFYAKTRALEDSDVRIDSKSVSDEKVTRERSLEHANETTLENVNGNDAPRSSIPRNSNYIDVAIFTDNENITDEKLSTREQQHGIGARSSIPLTENIDVNIRKEINNGNSHMKMVGTSENQELFEELVNYNNEDTIQERKMLIEVNRNSNLIAAPGTVHRVVFDVMNNCVLPVRYGFRAKSTPFRLYNVVPMYAWIYPGQMSKVAVDIIIPDNTSPDTASTVTLSIQGTEIKEKSAYVYVQGSLSKLTDDAKPKIEYTFNNNCAGKLDKSQCSKTRWSMDLRIQDYDSGLKRIISSANEVYPRTEFISGTRTLVTFFYSATCCDTTTKITAVDLLDNYNTVTIDVTEWNNLTEAQVAAISMGALLALLLIILIIILIICCIRRRKSLDLPYSQRYGSRPPGQAERTNL